MVDVQIATAEKKKITVPNLRVLWQFVRPHRRTLSLGMTLGSSAQELHWRRRW